jgi:hypothetical protein
MPKHSNQRKNRLGVTGRSIVAGCTRDTDFNQFPFLEVIDPLAQRHSANSICLEVERRHAL